jgi:dTDP-4-dehydrorhamnose 3,5-epimerase
MNVVGTALQGAFVIDLERVEDERGFFARSFCRREFEAHGLNPNLVQCNISYNRRSGTLRGMHYQAAPHPECKLVRCTRGSIYDVLVDIRPGYSTLGRWVGYELSAENRRMLYIPEGIAHGFVTLQDDTEVFYQMSDFYFPELQRGVRWNDPAFAIAWPVHPEVISDKDAGYPDFGG